MEIAHSYSEIKENLLTLESYRNSSDQHNRLEYRKLLAKGHCFVAYGAKRRVYFGPSRFIGYKNNTLAKHAGNNEKAGGRTNRVIESILATRFMSSAAIEKQFNDFCSNQDITPDNRARKYIGTGKISLNETDDLIYDIDAINSNRKLTETEKRRLVDARIGQGGFRKALRHYWRKCPVTGCSVPELLRASHIKPWCVSSNIERLDKFNGILLSPNLDLAFDSGLISFTPTGHICISRRLRVTDAKSLGITGNIHIPLNKQHLPYLAYHLEHVFQQ